MLYRDRSTTYSLLDTFGIFDVNGSTGTFRTRGLVVVGEQLRSAGEDRVGAVVNALAITINQRVCSAEPGRQGARAMQQPLPKFAAPSFYLTGRQRLSPGAILLAIAIAVGAVYAIMFALSHGHGRPDLRRSDTASAASSAASSAHDDDDDPNQIDTIVLGDPTDAPRPAKRGDHVSAVHPTILIVLPRDGAKMGLIPASPAGHLLYDWLAAFNKGSSSGLREALPNVAPGAAAAAQMELRRRTGGFNLLSAKEVQPGVLVFRLRDQSAQGVEVLGTLQVNADVSPAEIASFSLRGVDAVALPTGGKLDR